MTAEPHVPICYFRASVRPKESLLRFADLEESFWVVHVYVPTEDTTDTGAVGSEFISDSGLEFLEFLCLPQAIVRSQIGEHEAEHIQAWEAARRGQIALVVSVAGVLR